ncbi:gb [Venturia nashicola]|nr:gb [Venturia nashicola]
MSHSKRQKTAEAALVDQTDFLSDSRLLIVFGAMALTFFITYADQNGIAVSLPAMARELDAQNTISWAGTSSFIGNTVFQVLYGRMSDILGRKVVYLSAVTLLAVADILCATAHSGPALYVFRGLSGVAIGGINSLTMMIVSDIVSLERRGNYQGMLGGMIGMGNIAGPFISAAFTQHAHTWRGFFYFISPTTLLCGIVAFFLIPYKKGTQKGSEAVKLIDWAGLFTACVAIIFFLVPISGGGSYFAWSSAMVVTMLAISLASAIAFVLVEWKVAMLPLMPLTMFKTPAVAAILAQNFLFGCAYYSELYYLPIYFQNVRGWTPIASSALLVPFVLAQAIFSIASGFYISRYKRYGEVLWIGFTCWTAGAGSMCAFDRDTPIYGIILTGAITGIGVGNVFQPCLIAIQAHSPKTQRAVVISNRNFLRALGGAIGLAVSAQVLQTTLKESLPDGLRHIASSAYARPNLDDFDESDKEIIKSAYMTACRMVFVSLAPFMGVCLLGCLLIKDRGLQRKEELEAADNIRPEQATENLVPGPDTAASRTASTHNEKANTEDLAVVEKC